MNEVKYQIGMSLEYLEKLVILKAMDHFRGNKMSAAGSLGIDRRTLDHRLEKYADDEIKEQERLQNEQSRREEFLLKSRGNPPNNIGIPYNPGFQQAQQYNTVQNSSSVREPAINFAPKQSMPMSQRPDIQELPSKNAPKSSKGK